MMRMKAPGIAIARGSRRLWPLAALVVAGSALPATAGVASAGVHDSTYRQVNLVSDIPGLAPNDPDLVNSWGVSAPPGTDQTPGGALWVSDNGKDKTTLYTAATATTVNKAKLVVTITSGAPTGQVFNGDTNTSDFVVRDAVGNSGSAAFIFASENGGIDAWNANVGVAAGASPPSTVTEVAHDSGANAVYKGLAQAQASDGKTYLYATNFRSGHVEVYDSHFKPVELPGGLFVDRRLPAGYAPFDIAEFAGKLYVTYAKQDAGLEDDVAGPGHGFVDVFTNDGALIRRLVTRGALNSPWGLALAPGNFGRFSGALLVGNFGDGHINAYDPGTGAHLGQLRGTNGRPIAIEGLWSLRFGNGNVAKTNELIFSSGPGGETHGLLGKLVLAS
jgi:uncharacterized protein (TIGR03118 family)